MDTTRDAFHAKHRLEKYLATLKAKPAFRQGVASLKELPGTRQQEIFAKWSNPIDPTWAETGAVGNGTTDAGQDVEQEIADACISAVKKAMGSSKTAGAK
jgi:hypothetical protein